MIGRRTWQRAPRIRVEGCSLEKNRKGRRAKSLMRRAIREGGRDSLREEYGGVSKNCADGFGENGGGGEDFRIFHTLSPSPPLITLLCHLNCVKVMT